MTEQGEESILLHSSDDNVSSHENSNSDGSETQNNGQGFKRPILLFGPRKGPHKFTQIKIKTENTENDTNSASVISSKSDTDNVKLVKSPAETLRELDIPLPYKEPKWGSIPERRYFIEVIKDGTVVETINLKNSYFVFGRSSVANCVMAHNSISRFHAVLQFGKKENDGTPGFYVFDLNSTSGTFLNKMKIKPNLYVRVQVGHMLKFAMSTRLYILQGPPDDEEPESELTVTELKNIQLQKKLAAQMKKGQSGLEAESEGIDWGMGEDAEEESDLSVNPFAAAPNEELYIDDPKKTLRGWFEREGCDLEYDCQEKGFGQFVCRVELPVEDIVGKSMVAEAVVKGKKKEAVVQCALEACRILDQYGLLRQAKHESRKKKTKDWEADDFYDSDEDSFLDRTGTVERKRQKRMQEAGVSQVVHTYPGLLEEHKRLVAEVERVTSALTAATPSTAVTSTNVLDNDDELDQYMAKLTSQSIDKVKINALKGELSRLKQDELRIRTLANVARPAGTTELEPPWPSEQLTLPAPVKARQAPIIGKRRGPFKKLQIPKEVTSSVQTPQGDGEEFDSD